jgi:hypothetical protein
MSVKINWALNVQIVDGPKISTAAAVDVDAYDNVEVTVPKHQNNADGTAIVEVQPGAQNHVLFLLIKADTYKDSPLSYKVEGSNKSVKLDAQQMLVGAGAIGLLDGAPTKLTFSNTGPNDAAVRILIGRKAT